MQMTHFYITLPPGVYELIQMQIQAGADCKYLGLLSLWILCRNKAEMCDPVSPCDWCRLASDLQVGSSAACAAVPLLSEQP